MKKNQFKTGVFGFSAAGVAIALISLAFVLPASAGKLPYPKLEEVLALAKDITSEKYPDADYAIIDNLVSSKYNTDGTDATVDDEYIVALTESGRRRLSTVSVWYSASYGSAEIECAEIIKKDGRVVPVDVKANSRTTIDTGQMGANIYDKNSKYITLSIPNVEIGDIRHLRIRRSDTKTRMPNQWSDYTTFESTCPIIKTTYMVSAPEKLPLVNRVLRAEITNTISYASSKRADGGVDHVWKINNVPRYFSEPSMPDAYTVVQRVLVSTLPDWETVSRWYAKLCEKPLADVTDEMREKTSELIADAETDIEKIRAIFAFVSQKIRYMGVTTEDVAPGFEPHPVSVTFNNRYGVCRDKAALLTAMLRLAGFDAYPVLIMVGPKRDPEVPSIAFNHAITAVREKNGNYMLMDCTNENTKDLMPAYLGNCSYLVASPKGEKLKVSPVYPVDKQMLDVLTRGELDASGNARFNTSISFKGINDNAYRGHLLKQTPEKRRSFFEGLVKRCCPGAKLLAMEIQPEDLQNTDEPLKVELDYYVEDFPVRGESVDTLQMPWFTKVIGYANFVIGDTGLKTRKYPLMTEIACGTEEFIVIMKNEALGKNDGLPADVASDAANIEYQLQFQDNGNALIARRTYKVKSVEFSPSEYVEMKRQLQKIDKYDKTCVLFAPRSDSDRVDVEILEDSNVLNIKSDSEWEETIGLRKRILTYAGIKNSSEIKLSWNPAWQELELISATVSNLNGKVVCASTNEIHAMDAQWVRAAPRYPAEKLMVVNLPAVEVGSVIDLRYRKKFRNHLFVSRINSFASFLPMSNSTFVVSYPSSMDLKYRLFNGENIAFSCRTNGSTTLLDWTSVKSRKVKQETKLPAWYHFQPTVYLSSGNWKTNAEKIFKAFDERASKCENAARFARELTKKMTDKREMALAVSREIIRIVRSGGTSFINLPLSALSTADRTLADKYGNSADRAILLSAMLKALDIDCEILLASHDDSGCEEAEAANRLFPQLDYFSIPLVRAKFGDEFVYLNEGTRFNEPGTSCNDQAYVLSRDGTISNINVAEGKKDRVEFDYLVELDKDGTAEITFEKRIYGVSVGNFRKQYNEMLPEIKRRQLLEIVGSWGNGAEPVGELHTDTVSYPAVMRYKARVRDYALIQNSRMHLKLPTRLTHAVFSLGDDARENPMFFSKSTPSSIHAKIIFPDGYSLWSMVPKSVCWTLPGNLGRVEIKIDRSKDEKGRLVLNATRNNLHLSGEVAPELYPTLLEYNRRIRHAASSMIVVE